MDKKSKLDDIAESERFGEGINGLLMKYRYEKITPFFRGRSCLELGCADGLMTEHLVDEFEEVVAVDGSEEYCNITQESIKAENLTVINSLFQDYNPNRKFETIVACHVLEHVEKPVEFLKHIRELLGPDGRLIIDVPNANSIHRKVGVKMGLLNRVDELNDRDIRIGHQRVYRPDEFNAVLRDAGFEIEHSGGVFFKPVTNSQMENWFTPSMMEGFAKLGDDFPELAAEIYRICLKKGKR